MLFIFLYFSGKIYLSSEVNENFYEINVLALDQDGLNTSVGVHIIVDDVNNHKPMFINSSPVEKRVFIITNSAGKSYILGYFS